MSSPNACPACQQPLPTTADGGVSDCPCSPAQPTTQTLQPQHSAGTEATWPLTEQKATLTIPPVNGSATPVEPQAEPKLPTTIKSEPPKKIGRFLISERLGEGAFGIVYRAYDPQLDREVALKLAKPDALNSDRRVRRFLSEAKAAANLRHPNIVAVHDSGQDGDHYYIASAFIPGGTLAAELEARSNGRLEPRRAVEVVRKLAEALAYAHKRVVHRDVKPANVLLDETGEPLLADFGLAARSEPEEHRLAQEEACGGTPAYMAPEQAEGNAVAASDQYSLGCTLYELVTGQTPFAGTPAMQIYLHKTKKPPSPRQFNTRLDRDLEAICLKCLEKDATRRYSDCQALASDLRRWLDGIPASIRQVGLLERLLRWCKRQPQLAGSIGAAVTALLVGAVISWVLAIWAIHERERADDRAEEARQQKNRADERAVAAEQAETRARIAAIEANTEKRRANDAKLVADTAAATARDARAQTEVALRAEVTTRKAAERNLYFSSVYQAEQLTFSSNWTDARRVLEGAPRDLRRLEWQLLYNLGRLDAGAITAFEGGSKYLAVDPSSSWVGAAGKNRQVKLWKLGPDEPMLNHQFADAVIGVGFSNYSSELFIAADRKNVRFWDLPAEGTPRAIGNIPEDGLAGIAISSDGRWLVTGRRQGLVTVREIPSGKEITSFKAHANRLQCVAMSIGAGLVATGGSDQTIGLWNWRTGKLAKRLQVHSNPIASIAFSQDGRHLAAIGTTDTTAEAPQSEIVVWDVPNRAVLARKRHVGSLLNAVAFSPDGRQILVGSDDRLITAWEVVSSVGLQSFAESSSGGGRGGGKRAQASAKKLQKMASVEDKPRLTQVAGFPAHDLFVSCLASNDRLLLSGGNDSTIRMWDVDGLRNPHRVRCRAGSVRLIALDGSDKLETPPTLTLGMVDSSFHTYSIGDPHTKAKRQDFSKSGGAQLLTLQSGRVHNAIVRTESALYLADSSSSGRQALPGAPQQIKAATISADRRAVACYSVDSLYLWDVPATTSDKPKLIQSVTLPNSDELPVEINVMAFDPHSEILVAGDRSGRIWSLDIKTGKMLPRLAGHIGEVDALAWSAKGCLASASCDGTIRIWDVRRGAGRVLNGHNEAVTAVIFDRAGDRLISSSRDGTLKIWEPAGARCVATIPVGSREPLLRLALSPDDRWLAVLAENGVVSVFNLVVDLKR